MARSSWTIPTTVLATITSPNRASWSGPTTRMTASSDPSSRLKRVSRLARTIWPTVRVGALGTSLTCPLATRWATSAALRPPLGHPVSLQ